MNEKMKILEMLEEGKITVEESLELIAACNENSTFEETCEKIKMFCKASYERLEPYGEEAIKNAKEVYKKAEPFIGETITETKKAIKKVEPKIKKTASTVVSATKDAINNIKNR